MFPTFDRLVRKEVALGTIREKEPPQTHIGLRLIAPFKTVESDDVIFDFAKGLTDGLVPARAEDAESELAQKDILFGGTGRASVIDWAQKDHYNASDVTRYREQLMLQSQLGTNISLPLTVGSMTSEFAAKLARDEASRRRRIDNRMEWMIMQALATGGISYNDGKIKFTVDYGRPAGQQAQAPIALWTSANAATMDPIKDIQNVQQFMFDTYGIRIKRAIASKKILDAMVNSDRFAARTGLAPSPIAGGTIVDPKYLIAGWGPEAAKTIVQQQTGLTFIEYDSVYRTRPIGSTTITNNRFLPENGIIFLPEDSDIAEVDDTGIGFAKTLTSPHPEGNWSAGYYEWEEETKDPWGLNRGSGIKAFPVFPFMQYTFQMNVLP
jgi:hypothetical protein